MEQDLLFNFQELDNKELDRKISKTKLGYSSLLKHEPNIKQDAEDGSLDLFTWAIAYRRIIGNLLIELSDGKLEATDYLTNKRYAEDRSILCDNAFIELKHLQIWTSQILNGGVCFDDRMLDDCLKAMNGFSKKRPEIDLSVIEDWSDEYPEDALNQLDLDLNE
jgi:hypothetical protein